MDGMVDHQHLEEIQEATNRLVRTVDAMTDDEYAAPSGLPGWSRAHVVAHLTLNAEGLAAALGGVVAGGGAVPMYASQEARDADIEELAAAGPGTLRPRLMAASTDFADALGAVPADRWSTRIERTRGSGTTFPAGAVPGMRHREVEIHHADLGLGYTRTDWAPGFAARVVEAMARRPRAEPFTARATDLDRSWQCGDGGPTVSGTAADLGWWMTGRGDGTGLVSDDGVLPRNEEW